MGNEEAKPSAVGEDSGFRRYWIEMQRQPATEIPPFRHPEISYLKQIFEELDTKHTRSIEVDDFDNFYYLREHPLYECIRKLFKEELEKIKVKKITFDIMLYLLKIESKYRYLFRLYDWDKDFKLNSSDLIQTFEILFYGPMYSEETYQTMADHLISKHGAQGFISFEAFIRMVPEREVRELMTLKFLQI